MILFGENITARPSQTKSDLQPHDEWLQIFIFSWNSTQIQIVDFDNEQARL